MHHATRLDGAAVSTVLLAAALFAASCGIDNPASGSPAAGDGSAAADPSVGGGAANAAGSPQAGGTAAHAGGDSAFTAAIAGSGGTQSAPSADAGQGPIGTNEPVPVAGNQAPTSGANTPEDAAISAPDAGAAPLDCTPIAWPNAGNVEVPALEAVAADAGKGAPFAALTGIEPFAYEQREFFLTGTSPAAFTTRINVYKPKDPAKFSGTLFVEWYNDSSQFDFAAVWASSREYFMREGHGFVAVSAQSIGIDYLKRYDADRYAKLQHPGDTYAEAIYSRAGAALKTHPELFLGDCFPVHALIAVGRSEAAIRLGSYLDGLQASDKVYDGFMLHSGFDPRSNDPGVPVMQLFTMQEAMSTLDDGPTLVKWMIAGATRNDRRLITRSAEATVEVANAITGCVDLMNDFPAYRAYNAAFDALHAWVRTGVRPPAAPRFATSSYGGLQLDDNGNVVGGLRLPDIDVPIAAYSTTSTLNPTDPTAGIACSLGGATARFSEEKLEMLYVTHEAYVMKYKAAADKSLAAGYLLPADYDEALQQAKSAHIPN